MKRKKISDKAKKDNILIRCTIGNNFDILRNCEYIKFRSVVKSEPISLNAKDEFSMCFDYNSFTGIKVDEIANNFELLGKKLREYYCENANKRTH